MAVVGAKRAFGNYPFISTLTSSTHMLHGQTSGLNEKAPNVQPHLSYHLYILDSHSIL